MSRVERIGDAELWLGDCREILPTIGAVDAVITDPPYNCGKAYGVHNDSMDTEDYCRWLSSVWARIPADTLIYTPGDRHLWDVPRICGDAGFSLGRPLAWHRKEFAGDKWYGGPAMSWEPVIWAYQGKKKFNRIYGHSGRDHLTVNCVRFTPHRAEHPCPKPLEVMLWLVGIFAQESCLDPFFGTGTTAVACLKLGRRFVGIEIEERYFDITCRRIEDFYRQGDIFRKSSVSWPAQETLL